MFCMIIAKVWRNKSYSNEWETVPRVWSGTVKRGKTSGKWKMALEAVLLKTFVGSRGATRFATKIIPCDSSRKRSMICREPILINSWQTISFPEIPVTSYLPSKELPQKGNVSPNVYHFLLIIIILYRKIQLTMGKKLKF